MRIIRVYDEDLLIAKALINRDERITKQFFYIKCYPLFKSVFDRYYTGCESCKEFMDEIYMTILIPSKKTGKCQLENYKGESTLTSWLKSVCLFYCYHKFGLRQRLPEFVSVSQNWGGEGDRSDSLLGSISMDMCKLNRADIETLISMMPNPRYQKIIYMLHVEHMTHKEIANALEMKMENYYNKRILAEKQFKQIQKKEAENA